MDVSTVAEAQAEATALRGGQCTDPPPPGRPAREDSQAMHDAPAPLHSQY